MQNSSYFYIPLRWLLLYLSNHQPKWSIPTDPDSGFDSHSRFDTDSAALLSIGGSRGMPTGPKSGFGGGGQNTVRSPLKRIRHIFYSKENRKSFLERCKIKWLKSDEKTEFRGRWFFDLGLHPPTNFLVPFDPFSKRLDPPPLHRTTKCSPCIHEA